MISCADGKDLLEEMVQRTLGDAGQVAVIRDAPFSIAVKLGFPVTAAIEQMASRLQVRLGRAAPNWTALRGTIPAAEPGPWRHQSIPAARPPYFPGRAVSGRLSATPATRPGRRPRRRPPPSWSAGLRLPPVHRAVNRAGQRHLPDPGRLPAGHGRPQAGPPGPAARLGDGQPAPPPRLTAQEAAGRLDAAGQPFAFFIDTGTGRGSVVYHRYDGHYGLLAAAIGPLAAGNSSRYAALASSLALLVGLMGAAASTVRLGFLADLLSRPVIVGYLAGVAVIMIAGRLGAATGVPVAGRAFPAQAASFAERIGGTRPATAAIAASVLAFLFLIQWRWPRAPGALLAVLLAAGCVGAFGLPRNGVAVAGRIPAGWPAPALPGMNPGDLRKLLLPAFTVFVVGFSDLVLTARAFARRGEQVSANRELLTLGAANTAVSMLHGFPVSSSASRTATGTAAGSRTRLYSVTAAIVVVAVVVLARPLLASFPQAALAAIVIYAATRLIDVQAFRRLVAFRRGELVISASALAGVLAAGILYGVLIAIAVPVAELLLRVARPHDAILGLVPGLAGMRDVDDYPQARTIPGLVVYRYDAPLFFANAQDFRRRALAAARCHGPPRWFVLNVEANVEADFTAFEAMEALRDELGQDGTIFALARVKQDLLVRLNAFGVGTFDSAGG